MRLKEVSQLLCAKVLSNEDKLDMEIKNACGSDLMSDVLAFAKEQGLLLTGLINPQVVRTAEMMDIVAIVFVRGKCPDDSILKLSEERGIVLMTTKYPMYIANGILYSNGLVPKEG